jgi:MraZ protein
VNLPAPMFIGTYEHNIDDKGRLAIPARFRDELQETFFATRGLDKCLFIFPRNEWERQLSEFSKLPLTMRDARAYSRLFFSGACECELDRQGRINIPAYLREYAGLTKDAVVIGVMNRIEIWSREVWTSYRGLTEESYEEIAEKLAHGGIDQEATRTGR